MKDFLRGLLVIAVIALVVLAFPGFWEVGNYYSMQGEAKRVLVQIHDAEHWFRKNRYSFQARYEFWKPVINNVASPQDPQAFKDILGVELPVDARYTYKIMPPDSLIQFEEDASHLFLIRAEANLDDDPKLDIWTIDQDRKLIHVSDDKY